MNRSSLAAALVVLAGVIGCGSDASGPPLVDEKPNLVIIDGDGQSAAPGAALTHSLVIQASSPTGAPLAGWVVTWTVSGGGQIAGAPATDASGRAQAQWTLGSTGPQEAQATISYRSAYGLVPVSAKFSATISIATKPAILHYDGASWVVAFQAPAPASTGAVSLYSIWGSSPSSIWAVGAQCGNDVIVQFDGTSWGPTPNNSVCPLLGMTNVSGSSASNVFSIETGGTPGSFGSTVRHFDGTTWSDAYGRKCGLGTSGCAPTLYEVWTDSPNNAVVVGEAGFIAQYNGTSWTTVASGTTSTLRAVWGVASAATPREFAVGDAGTILTYDGTSWQAQPSGTTQTLRSVWGTSASDVFAVGDGGVILHYDGTSWSTQKSTGLALYGVWGSSPTSVFAVGDGPAVLHYDGSSWTSMVVNIPIDLRAVWGTSANNIYAVGQGQ